MREIFQPHVSVEEALRDCWARGILEEQTVGDLLDHFGNRRATIIHIVKALNKSWDEAYEAYMKQYE